MSVGVAPFVVRSLRLESRQFKPYLFRILLLLFMGGALILVHAGQSRLGAPGLSLFKPIVWMSLLAVCVAGPFFFASVITEEKEGMTLGFLKIAGLSPFSILLGKSSCQLTSAVTLLLAQVPFVMLAVTLGGVSTIQVVAAYAALLAHLVFVSNLALLCSTICKRTSGASGLTFVLLVAFFIGPWLGRGILMILSLPSSSAVNVFFGGLFDYMARASAFARIGAVMGTGFAGPALGFQFPSNLALGLVCFLLAWAGFESFNREETGSAPRRRLAFRRTSRLRRLGVGRPWRYALAWKDFYFTTGGKGAMLVKFAAFTLIFAAIFTLVSILGGQRIEAGVAGGVIMTTMMFAIPIELSLHMSRVFGNERRERTLCGIMILPKSTARIAWCKVLGCLLALAPALAFLTLGLILIAGDARREMFFSPMLLLYVPRLLLLFTMITYLSLVMRRGGLLVAFILWLFGSWFLGLIGALILALLFDIGNIVVVVLVWLTFYLGLAGLFYWCTLRRMERAAAE